MRRSVLEQGRDARAGYEMNLLPCPFCGSTEIRLDVEHNGAVQDVNYFCMRCDSVAAYGRCHTEEHAREAWNRRTETP